MSTGILILIAVVLVVVIVGIFIRRLGEGPRYSLPRLRRGLEDLLKRGYDGGFLVVSEISPTNRRFVQFRKYISADRGYGIELGFPNAEWSKPYFDTVARLLDDLGIQHSIENAGDVEMSFIYADFGKDTDTAFSVLKRIFTDVFELDESATFRMLLEHANVRDVSVNPEPVE